jgi:hypothetical protein
MKIIFFSVLLFETRLCKGVLIIDNNIYMYINFIQSP